VRPRDSELPRLQQWYSECARGRGVVTLVDGAVGAGKTTLLRSFAAWAGEQRALVVSASASAIEAAHPFGLFNRLIGELRLAGVPVNPLPAGLGGVGSAVLERLSELTQTVIARAQTTRLVLILDDVHYADDMSMQCLGYLVRRIDASGVMVVLGQSSCFERRLAGLQAETLHLPYCHELRLNPLSPDEITTILRERLGAPPADALVRECAELSGGNWLLLGALADDYVASGGAGELGGGDAVRRAYLRCLHRSDPEMLAVARAMSILGRASSPELVADLLEIEVATVRGSMAALTAAGLLGAEWFHREAAALMVLADLPPDEAAAMRSRSASILHMTGASALVVADQLLAARASDGCPWWTPILREAAREASERGEVAAALGYLRRAATVCDGPAGRASLVAELADTLWQVDPATAARHLPYLVQEVKAGRLTGAGALIPVKHLTWRGDAAVAGDLLGLLEARPGGAGQPDLGSARACWSLCYPDREATSARSGHDGGHAGPMDVALLRGTAAAGAARRAGDDSWAGPVRQGDPVGRLRGFFGTALLSMLFLSHGGGSEDMVRWSVSRNDGAAAVQPPMRQAVAETLAALAAFEKGLAATAMRHARTALELVPASSWGVAVGLLLSLVVRAAIELGDVGTAASVLSLPVPPIMMKTPFALPYLRALGRFRLATGRPKAALKSFETCGELLARWWPDLPELVDWRGDVVMAHLVLGDNVRAKEVLAADDPGLVEVRLRAHGRALRRLAAAADVLARPLLLRAAVQALEDCGGETAELFKARDDLAAAMRRMGMRPADVREPGETSPPAGERLVAAEPGTPAEEGEPAGRSGRAAAELTEAEHRVASLAASGLTNRQIAGRLTITVSTVEQHLTKIYRKLNVRRRSALQAGLVSADARTRNARTIRAGCRT